MAKRWRYGVLAALALSLAAGCAGQAGPGERKSARCQGVICSTRDADQDGVEDRLDRCPGALEDLDAYRDEDGCPDPDNDGDRILDAQDQCPLEAEDLDNFRDEDGCPEPDNDGDGILDVYDRCPDEQEDYDGDEDEDGCPEHARYHPKPEYMITEKIVFDERAAALPPDGIVMLDQIALVLIQNPHVPPMIIRGRAFEMDDEETNLDLSRERAQAVHDYLIKQGVSPSRISIDAVGSSRPLCDADSEGECQVYNRCVDFEILNEQ